MENINDDSGFLPVQRSEIATYHEQIIPEYACNPFIEALPPILSREEAVERLSVYPEFDLKERDLDAHFRYHFIQRLFRYFQPLPQHIDLEQRISRLIRQGYIGRNPRSHEYFNVLQNIRQVDLASSDQYDVNVMGEKQTAKSFTMIGISGIGKTTAIERVLALYPQIIIHETPLNLYQLVWLKLDCPFDGSVKGLCIQFFSEIDKLFGTNYRRKYAGSSRQSIDAMLTNMAQVAFLHGLGLLVIDEIQHLSTAKSGGAEKMLNFFVTLVNTIGVPVIAIGTPKALSILQSEFRQARRGTGQGDMVWNCMKRDLNWELLIEGMWEYQWIRHESPLNDEIREALYDESQGIVDMAIKLYMLAQIRAINLGIELISPDLIRNVAKESLQLTKPMINALKTGKLSELAKYDDIRPVDMEEQISKYTSTDVSELIRLQRIKEAEKRQKSKKNLLEEIVLSLLKMNIASGLAQKAAEQVIVKLGDGIDAGTAIKEAVVLALSMERNNSSNDKSEVIKPSKKVSKRKAFDNESQDLRAVIKAGKEKNLPAYDALVQAGFIKFPLSDFAI
ncbi:MAG: family ATPase [Firmicutes bacterium]|nr:family ATPase [Bacillota bacterium]